MTELLHPEFIKYWTNQGYSIKYNHNEADWTVLKTSSHSYVVAWYNRFYKKISYHMHVAPYNNLSEKDMLRFLLLRAFL